MKYCIGCVHLYFKGKEMGCGSEWTGSWTAEDAAIACEKGHWSVSVEDGYRLGFDFEKAMETADTCSDFKERPVQTQPGDK